MGQIRIGFQRVAAGSAAREAEDDARISGAPRSMRIEGGSAARAAEEAKRLGGACGQGASSFSLRAQGGRVIRTDSAQNSLASADRTANHASLTAKDLNAPPIHDGRSLDVAPGTVPPRAGPVHTSTGRLKSFLRGFFLPDETLNS